MTAVVQSCDGTDEAAVIVAVDALNPDANDRIFTYHIGNQVYFVKFPIA